MKLTFDGSVHYANGSPAPDVAVSIFDRDAAGRQDDDLTVTSGLSDKTGRFSVSYEPLRYMDYLSMSGHALSNQVGELQSEEQGVRIPDLGDIYLPYLRFNYSFNGLNYTHTCSMGVFQTKFFLPVNPAIDFLPSTGGFQFKNSFSGYFLPFSTPAFMSSRKVPSIYGLCGGMCAAAYDLALSGRQIPKLAEIPRQGTRLHRYLFQRQMDSLGSMGHELIKVAQWTCLPDDTSVGTRRRTADEFPSIRQKLEQKNPVILALIYTHASSIRELSRVIFNNHQVLAYACYPEASGGYTISIYDPNLPGRDDVVLQVMSTIISEEMTPAGLLTLSGLKCSELVGDAPYKDVRGFFEVPYHPVIPPKGI